MCYWLWNSTLNVGFHVLGARSHELTVSLIKEHFASVISSGPRQKESSESSCRSPTLTITDLRYSIHWPRSKIPVWFQRHLGFNKLFILYALPYLILIEKDPPLFSLLYELFNNAIFVYFLYTYKLIHASVCLGWLRKNISRSRFIFYCDFSSSCLNIKVS